MNQGWFHPQRWTRRVSTLQGLPGIFSGLAGLASGGHTGPSRKEELVMDAVWPHPDCFHLSSPRSARSLSRCCLSEAFPHPSHCQHDGPHILLPASSPPLSLTVSPACFIFLHSIISSWDIICFQHVSIYSLSAHTRILALMRSRGFCLSSSRLSVASGIVPVTMSTSVSVQWLRELLSRQENSEPKTKWWN